MKRLWFAALGGLLLALPVHAQQKSCPGSGSSSSSSSSTASTTTASSSTSTAQQVVLIQSQIAQLQQLLTNLQNGTVAPSASSGVTSAQAVQIVSNRIVRLQSLLVQVASTSRSTGQLQAATARVGGRR